MHPLFPTKIPWATLGRRETDAELSHQWQQLREQTVGRADLPLFRVWVAESTTGLEETLQSLLCQSYPHWEAVGSGAEWEKLVAKAADSRLRLRPGGQADWESRVAGGTVLSPVALSLFHLEALRQPQASLLYANHVFRGEHPHFVGKPRPSLLTLIHFNYLGSAFFSRSTPPADPEELHGWLLDQDLESFQLCPYYLFYYPESFKDVSLTPSSVAALEPHLRRHLPAPQLRIQSVGQRAYSRVTPLLEGEPELSVIIPFRDKVDWTVRAVKALRGQAEKVRLDLLLVNNDSTPESLASLERSLEGEEIPYRLVSQNGAFDYGRMNNQVVRNYARGELLFFLNNDVVLKGKGVLDEMAAWASLPWVGTVGMLLRYPNGDVQHDGIRGAFGGEARLARVGHFSESTPFTSMSREVFANTFAACMVRREAFDRVGGLREWEMNNGFGDVALNLECRRQGWHNLFLGHLEGVHEESGSRGRTYEYWEEFFLERDFASELQQMLRADLSWNRVPARSSWMGVLGDLARRGARHWLGPAKPLVKKGLRRLSLGGHNQGL